MSVYVEAWGLLSVPATLREALTLPGDRRGLSVRARLREASDNSNSARYRRVSSLSLSCTSF